MSFSPNSSFMQRTLDLQYENKKRAYSLKWSMINGVLFIVFAYDLSCKCPGYMSAFHYAEYALALLLGVSLMQHGYQLLKRSPPLTITNKQKELLGVADADTSFRILDTSQHSSPLRPPSEPLSVSLSPRSWRSADSRSASPSPQPLSPARADSNPDRFIADSSSLSDYLRQYEERSILESSLNLSMSSPPVVPIPQYQLASIDKDSQSADGGDDAGPGGAPQLWWRLQLDPQRLTQWNLNLRLVSDVTPYSPGTAGNKPHVVSVYPMGKQWLHVTILERLAREIPAVDEALARAGRHDIKLGQVSVERLRQSARTPGCGALANVLPFLEAFPDQKYLVQRIKELAVGGCLSNYKWNGGGAGWDDSKPTDAELLLHLLATYLDGQLPGAGAFSARHVSRAPAPPPRGADALAIHLAATRPPHYVLALGDDTIEVCRGRNNLLHTVLLFIAACARRTPPSINRVHLGPAGLNMLWIIS